MRRYFASILRYLIAIPICVILAAVAGLGVGKLTPNSYIATSAMFVDINIPDSYIPGQTTPATDGAILASGYAAQIPTPTILTFVYNRFPEIKQHNFTLEDLLHDITATTPALTAAGNTGGSTTSSSGSGNTIATITISATSKNEADAIMLTNDTAKGMQYYEQAQLQGQLNTLRQSLQAQIAAAQKQRASDEAQLSQITNSSDVRVPLLNYDISDMIHNIDTANAKLLALPVKMRSNLYVTQLASGQGVQSTSKGTSIAEYAALVGAINGLVVLILLVFHDERLRGAEQVKKQLGYAYVGGLFGWKKEIHAGSVPTSGNAAKQFNDICANLRLTEILPGRWKEPRGATLLITSPYIADGKTTIATGMAASFARVGRSVLVIDGNVNIPATHLAFGTSAGAFGLCDLLKGGQGVSIDTAVQRTDIPRVWLLPAGNPTDEAPLLLEENLPMLLTLLKQKMDMIIIDGPALLTGAIAPLLSGMVDGVALVVDSRNDNLKTLRQVKELLQMISDAPVGIILNRLRRRKRNAYYFTAPATPEEMAQPATVVDECQPDLVGYGV